MKRTGEKGLTLIEVLITITIIAVLASVVIPISRMSVKRSNEAELRENLRLIRTAIDEYKKAWDEGKIKKSSDDTGYPPDLETLVKGIEDATSAKSGKVMRFLRRVPRDPMNDDESLPPEETWGLRSYKSGPDEPEEGDDVYDVYSKSDGLAIDGTAYGTW
ncbi:MAG: type II secretion system protein [Deltaproteobacteria bacterium]|nr:type II secretion system protein [Deltaproteobacteria bacterium]